MPRDTSSYQKYTRTIVVALGTVALGCNAAGFDSMIVLATYSTHDPSIIHHTEGQREKGVSHVRF